MNKNFITFTLFFPISGIALYSLSLMLSPISYDFNLNSFLIIYGFYFFYLLGWISFNLLRKNDFNCIRDSCFLNSRVSFLCIFKLRLLNKIFFYLTIIFIFLNYYDFFVIGDVINKGIVGLREERTLEGQRASLVGFFIVLLSATPVVLLTLTYLVAKEEKIRSYKLYYFIASIGVFAYLLSGGRNNFFIAILFFIIFASFISASFSVRKKRTSFLKGLFLVVFIILTLIFFLSIFIDRAGFQGISVRDYVERVDGEFKVDFYYLDFTSKNIEDFYYASLVLLFYLNHSIMELSKYFEVDWSNHTYGVLLFPLLSMAVDKIFSMSLFVGAIDKMILHGVYLSMPGFLYIDFSYFYFLFPIFIGFFLPLFYRKSLANKRSSIVYLYLYVSLVVLMMTSPIYNAAAMLIFPLIISLSIFVLILFIRRVF